MKLCSSGHKVTFLLVLFLLDFAFCETEPQPQESDENNLEESETDDSKDAKYSLTNCKCGRSNNNNKIVGGFESKLNAWPWMAAIVNVQGGDNAWTIHCGGSIICNQYILTAAHCIPPIEQDGYDNYRILIGDNTINGGTAGSRKAVRIKSIRPHPRYNATTFNFDAALIKLASPLKFNANVLPVCLGQGGRLFVNRTATVTGWGSTFFGGQGVNKLRETTVKVINNTRCNEAYQNTQAGGITGNQICAFTPKQDSCQGDSGGPLFVNRTNVPNKYKQVGIVSFGQECASETHPGVYTRVQKIINWIIALTKDGKYCPDSFTPLFRDDNDDN